MNYMKRKTTPQLTVPKPPLKRYQVKKSVMAESLIHALEIEKQASVEHVWLDDNQPEMHERTPLIGFSYEEDEYNPHSEEMKK